METNIDITNILSQDLKSRSSVKDLLLYIQNLDEHAVNIDFAHVLFATRSFIDEYYNVFIKSNDQLNHIKVATINIPEDIKAVFLAVSRTQNGEKKEALQTSTIQSFTSVTELNKFLSSLMI